MRRALASESTVYAACGVTLALGLFFIFAWAPHPWGWEGFDHYHQLALAVAAGQRFPTMDVPWGYAYFLAAFYRLFGDHPWIPLTAQAVLNAWVPWLVYRFARSWLDRSTAILAAAITGVCSFNTVYASTQSSDAVCTVIFLAALVAFAAARQRDAWRWYAAAGALAGLAPQFRPNLILVPLLLAAYAFFERPASARLARSAVLVACAAAALAPWVARNYRLTHLVLPTSVHGGEQLWYGTLQVGPYLDSRAYNPRAAFDAPVFDYTSLDQVPLLVTTRAMACADGPPSNVSLVYWTDRDSQRQRLVPAEADGGRVAFEIPAPGGPAVAYYYFDATWPSPERGAFARTTPADGEAAPFVYFVSHDHLGDLDVHGDLLDVFDLVRIARHVAWREPLPFERQLAAAGIRSDDLEPAVALLGRAAGGQALASPLVSALERDEGRARILLQDGSSIAIPRAWNGRVTDVTFDGALALGLMRTTLSLASLARRDARPAVTHEETCAALEDVAVNRVFYREEPHRMGRYAALAADNIRRDPFAFARASAYRAVRLFVIEGTADRHTAQQFSKSGLVYAAATWLSATYLLLFVAGVAIAWRHGSAILLPLGLIAYVPITIAAVLTNMRYSITVQPLVFMFIAVAVIAMLERLGVRPSEAPPTGAAQARDRAGR